MPKAKFVALLFTITLFALSAATTYAEDKTTTKTTSAEQPGDVRGGIFEYNWATGRPKYWEPFLKIQFDNGKLSEDGEAEIWGFRIKNLEPPDENGITRPVNVVWWRFVECDGRAHLVTIPHPTDKDREVEAMLRCPDTLWGTTSTADASSR